MRPISVITACHNQLESTKRCLNQILDHQAQNQLGQIQEIFVHSNGSTDGTNEWLIDFAANNPLIKPVFSSEALGYARAFNFPIQFCTTDYLILINNDAFVFNNWMDLLLEPLIKDEEDVNSRVGMSGVMYIDKSRHIIGGECVAIERRVFEDIGLLNESFDVAYGEDEEFSLRMARARYTPIGVATVSESQNVPGKIQIDYPIEHPSNTTTSTLGSVTEMIKRGSEKIQHISKGEPRFVVFPDIGQPKYEQWLEKYPDASFLLVDNDLLRLSTEVHLQEMFRKRKNFFIVPHIFGDNSLKSRLTIATLFYGTGDIIVLA